MNPNCVCPNKIKHHTLSLALALTTGALWRIPSKVLEWSFETLRCDYCGVFGFLRIIMKMPPGENINNKFIINTHTHTHNIVLNK